MVKLHWQLKCQDKQEISKMRSKIKELESQISLQDFKLENQAMEITKACNLTFNLDYLCNMIGQHLKFQIQPNIEKFDSDQIKEIYNNFQQAVASISQPKS